MPIRKIDNPEEFRANVCEKLNNFFVNAENEDKKKAYANNLEKGIHNWSIKEATTKKVVKKWDNPFFVQIYIDHLRSVYINMKNNNLQELVFSKQIKAHEIAFMTHQEMKPTKWETMIKAKSIRDKNKYETKLEAMTDTFTCRKCKSKKCSYYAMQTKSGDEPMTLFIQCLDCGARMKK